MLQLSFLALLPEHQVVRNSYTLHAAARSYRIKLQCQEYMERRTTETNNIYEKLQ